MLFSDRRAAGKQLAQKLRYLKGRADVLVLGIPRGGVVVADEVSAALGAPLDVFITRKIGAPFNPELALGAVASDGTTTLDDKLIAYLKLSRNVIERERDAQLKEIQRRAELYRAGQPAQNLFGKIIVVVDDGIATGSTVVTTLRAIKKHAPAHRVLAVPVAPPQVVGTLKRECEDLVVLETPDPFQAVGLWYERFEQVSDSEVVRILGEARARVGK